MKKVSLIVLGTIFILLAISVPSSYSQTIYACITKQAGQIRIVSTPGDCRSNETSIFWNQIGPQGERGTQGPPGPVGGTCPEDDPTKTNLLFPFVSNRGGFDTAIVISNTGLDPFGTADAADGTCTLYYYGDREDGTPLPNPIQTSVSIAKGKQLVFTLFGGSAVVGIDATPGFQGYLIVQCNFPYAHGFGVFSDLGAQKLASTILPLTICSKRVPVERLLP